MQAQQKTFKAGHPRNLDSLTYRHYNANESKEKESSILWITNYCRYKTEPAASTALPAPNICCCKWWTNITLQGWSGKLKLYAGKPHIHSCWWLSKWRIGTMICRRGLRRRLGQAGFCWQGRKYACMAGAGCAGIRQQYSIKEDCKVILGGYSLAGLFALWAATQTNAAVWRGGCSPSRVVSRIGQNTKRRTLSQAQRVYLSLGDREEYTRNQTMAAVGDNIRALHSALTQRGKDCRLEWNAGGHFKDADLRTARAFAWIMEGKP